MDRKEYLKEYYKKHRDEMLAYQKQYQKEHRNELLAYWKQYREEHRDERLACCNAWKKIHMERVREIMRKVKAKRRKLGFVPLNEPFEGAEAHHIDKERVIYMPKEYHRSVRHNVWTGENMALINNLAYDYLLETKISIAQGGA